MPQTKTAQRLEELLVRLKELGIATPQQIEQAKQEQAKTQERFGSVLAKLGIIRDADSGKRLAIQLGWIPKRLDPSVVSAQAIQRVPADLCRAHRIVPLQEDSGGSLVLATDDPFTAFSLDWLERRLGCDLDVVLVHEQDLNPLLARLNVQTPQPVPAARETQALPETKAIPEPKAVPEPRRASPQARKAPAAQTPSSPQQRTGQTQQAPVGTEQVSATDEPIIRLVDSILAEAVRMRASDIHVEPLANRLVVRYRIDGVLREVNTPPKALQGPITSRIKILAGLNIAEKRLPQDGRLQLTAEGKPLDVRLSTLPALHGESIVMRLLDRGQSIKQLHELGMAAEDAKRWEQLIRRPYGMVLATGPTGSGKTTTLYATLATLNTPERKLITVEDPVEYQLPGVNQVHVRTAVGLTFAAGLRAMLRQAPDIIMVGEIRDQETAQIAIQAALTGHLVFSTLHTNDASSAVTRLIDMGIAPFLVASTIQGVLAQRLVRHICPSCQERRPATPEEQAFLGEPNVSHVSEGNGCEQCHRSGYFGRIGIYELLCLSDTLRQLVVTKSQASNLLEQAVKEGMHTLRDDGRLKVREGLTTVTEILRATPETMA